MEEQAAEFELKFDFEKQSSTPQRVFKSLSDLIIVFEKIDQLLAKTIDIRLETSLVLEDVQSGSIRTKLAIILKAIPDEGLKELDWKKAVGYFLLKGKYFLLKKLEDKKQFSNLSEVKSAIAEIQELARETHAAQLDSYGIMSTDKFISFIEDIHKAISSLHERDQIEYISRAGIVRLNPNFDPSNLPELLIEEKLNSEKLVSLKVKKADFLGDSKWDFILEGKVISAKIVHYEWLDLYHRKLVKLDPGNSLLCKLRTEYLIGANGKSAQVHYTVLEVIDIDESSSDINPQAIIPPSFDGLLSA